MTGAMKMNKRQQTKFAKLLESFKEVNDNFNEEEVQEELNNLYTYEDAVYEAQAVYNFFKARVQPLLEKKETPASFDKRFREWRIRVCEGCNEEFAYAFSYDGVKFCSLECLDSELRKIGLQVTRGRDLKKRWGVFHHPAIVPSSAFAALKTSYSDDSPDAFVNVE